jgi:hypothetical protein
MARHPQLGNFAIFGPPPGDNVIQVDADFTGICPQQDVAFGAWRQIAEIVLECFDVAKLYV